ncbi:taxadiene 5-alpha hydroxylase-like [Solanum tuberosum]|uniref:Cytochrome P450 n=1 Tax=Solanum tuberosum TaxID=4113 RepID=M1C0N1_SOLTU|nr:PREDICTED: taxadiene 5-alpha hydroxylase-like [Solanum tuberosum]
MNIIVTIFLFLLPVFLLLVRRRRSLKRVPPGSLGIPIIGQSLGMLRAMKANTAEKWLEERVQRYGPISKLSLFGKPTVFIYGQAANKFVFTSDCSVLTNQQPQSVKMILGDRCLLELNGEDHKRVRDALVSFLKPDCLKRYVGKMEEEVRIHLETCWKDKQIIKVLPLMKTLTFNIICSLLFGLERGSQRDQMVHYFEQMIEGVWSIPINLPFMRFNRSLKASKDVQKMLKQLILEKRHEFDNNLASSHQDLITCLLSIRGENNQELISETEIIHNVMLIMVAGYDTSSILITFIVRLLAKNPNIYAAVLKEQEEIAQIKSPGESLTWEDLVKMKYTWRVAMETMRMFPPVFGNFRQTVKDIEYGGYLIPKGWQIFWVMAKTHMDSSIFQEPEKFDPARFENSASLPPYNFVPFGGGARICPGYEFAKIETLVTIHYLVTHFTWKLCCTDDFFSRDPMPVPTQGLPIQIVPTKPL